MAEPELSREAKDALSAFGAATDEPMTPGERHRVWTGATGAERRPSPWLALAVSTAVGFAAVMGVVLFTRPVEVTATGTSDWKREGELVTVRTGQVRLAPRKQLAVRTPQLTAVLKQCAALFDVTARGTVLSVESGEVEWNTRSRKGVARAGQTVTILAAPTAVLPVETKAPEIENCDGACLVTRAEGTGLAAEYALYSLAMAAHARGALDESARLFGAYGTRFPNGTFAPEAAIARMVDLLQSGRPDDARAEAEAFASRFAEDPRVGDVTRWHDEIP